MRGDKSRKVHRGADFSGGPVVKTLPRNAGVTGSVPGQECNKVGKKKKKKWAQGPGCKRLCKELDLDYEAIEGFLSREGMWQLSISEISFWLKSPLMRTAREEGFFILI